MVTKDQQIAALEERVAELEAAAATGQPGTNPDGSNPTPEQGSTGTIGGPPA